MLGATYVVNRLRNHENVRYMEDCRKYSSRGTANVLGTACPVAESTIETVTGHVLENRSSKRRIRGW